MRRLCRLSAPFVLACALACALAGAVAAAPTRIAFTGVVTANNPFVNTPPIGSPILGAFTFDPANTAGEGANCSGVPNCWSGPTSFWEWNGLTISATSGSILVVPSLFAIRIALTNSAAGAGADRYEVTLTGFSLTTIKLTLADSSGTALEAASNPLVPSFARFNTATYQYQPACFTGISCAGNPYHSGTLASFSSPKNADLAGLAVSAGALAPAFAGGTPAYQDAVPNGVSALTVTPTAVDGAAAIKVNGATVASGNPSGLIALAVGSNPIAIQVTSRDGTTTRNYSVNVTRAAMPPPVLLSAVSRKTHGGAGVFDLPLSTNPADPSTEPRAATGGVHTLVFTFDKAVTGGSAQVASGAATAAAPVFAGATASVALSGVADGQYVTVALANVASADGGTGGSGAVRVGFLLGDVDGNRTVSLGDLLLANAALTLPVTPASYLRDLNASGSVSVADLLAVWTNLQHALPAP